MKYVVKLGGAGLEVPELLQGCVRAITDLVRDGNQVAVVHGGGVQLTRMMERLGAKSEFINGLRVTDAETRNIALMVFAGKVNKGLVAACREALLNGVKRVRSLPAEAAGSLPDLCSSRVAHGTEVMVA